MRTISTFTLTLLFATACGTESTSLSRASEGDSEGASGDCTLTQGYWKNHEEAWDVTTLTLGSTSYSQEQLLEIFRTPVRGNGLVSLAHQLIAAKLNVANGAADGDISDEIAAADALIGSLVVPPIGEGYLATSETSDLVGALDGFNNSDGETCNAPAPSCGDGDIEGDEECDDGNTTDGDGCSATCTTEDKVPCCGDHILDAGEQCDDGNTNNGDGCSSTCQTEKQPCCGDNVVDSGEQCDDGNTTSGDGCSATCQVEVVSEPTCGNGHMDAGEECDDGNTIDGDGCSSTCVCEPTDTGPL
jgi:cysteine-rich repeat protein